MKRIVLLLFLFPLLSFACDEHPKTQSNSPLWLKYLVQGSKKRTASHKGHNHNKKKASKPETEKRPHKQ